MRQTTEKSQHTRWCRLQCLSSGHGHDPRGAWDRRSRSPTRAGTGAERSGMAPAGPLGKRRPDCPPNEVPAEGPGWGFAGGQIASTFSSNTATMGRAHEHRRIDGSPGPWPCPPPPGRPECRRPGRSAGPSEGACDRIRPLSASPAPAALLEDGKPVRLGSRALELLIALVERPGELVAKDELMARAWPNTFVEPGNLKTRSPGYAGHWLTAVAADIW